MLSGNINTPTFAREIALLPAALQKALRFLHDTNLAAHEPGRFDMELEGMPVVLQVLDLQTSPREALRGEVHRINIDVQLLAAGGPEQAVWYPDLGEDEVSEDLLNTPRDILFYENDAQKSARENTLEFSVGSYAVYFPWDVHVPAIQVGANPAAIRKIVLKVPMSACEQV